jgi:hypothetical protein
MAVWNANGLSQRTQEINIFLRTNKIDVLIASETHVTDRSHINIPHYAMYHTPHPDKKAHGGTAVIVRQNLKHHLGMAYSEEHIQATSIVLEDHIVLGWAWCAACRIYSWCVRVGWCFSCRIYSWCVRVGWCVSCRIYSCVGMGLVCCLQDLQLR